MIMVANSGAEGTSVLPVNWDTFGAQLFWIGVFTVTAKAALSISFDDDGEKGSNNPSQCKVMCMIGLLYCFLVDQSLFAFKFEPSQLALGGTIAVLTLAMLGIHASVHTKK